MRGLLQKLKSFMNKDIVFNKGVTSNDLFKEEPILKGVCGTCPFNSAKIGCVIDSSINSIRLESLLNESGCIFKNAYDIVNTNKDIFLIIDDNEGMVSFLKDDLDYLKDIGVYDNIEILTLSGSHSAFTLKAMLDKIPTLNIKYAIIDITLGGSIMTPKGNLKYTGIDVLDMLYNKNLKYIFYTGNNLNPYIKRNKELIQQFFDITEEDIQEHILFKTSMDLKSRRKYIAKKFFDEDIKG